GKWPNAPDGDSPIVFSRYFPAQSPVRQGLRCQTSLGFKRPNMTIVRHVWRPVPTIIAGRARRPTLCWRWILPDFRGPAGGRPDPARSLYVVDLIAIQAKPCLYCG